MKKLLPLFAVMIATKSLAGSGMSGGTPPAIEQLEEMLINSSPSNGFLFDNGLEDLSLLIDRNLLPQMSVTKNRLLKNDIQLSESDFDLLSLSRSTIDAVGALGEKRSYSISAGEQMESLIITDRRAAARTSVIH